MIREESPGKRAPVGGADAPSAPERAALERLGATVRRLRQARGMTRRALAVASGISERYLSQLEGGLANPTVGLLWRLSAALGEALSALLSAAPGTPGRGTVDDILHAVPTLSETDRDRLREALAGAVQPTRPPRVALVGLDGTGKTTLGRGLARHLGCPFVELARELGAMGAAPADYAARERSLLAALPARYPTGVLEAPSHLALRPGNFSLLLETCRTVWLRADPSDIASRLASRSTTAAGEPDAGVDYLRALLAKRTPVFAKSALTFDTSGLTPDEALERLCRLLS